METETVARDVVASVVDAAVGVSEAKTGMNGKMQSTEILKEDKEGSGLKEENTDAVDLSTEGMEAEEEKRVLEAAIRDLVESVTNQSQKELNKAEKAEKAKSVDYQWNQTAEIVSVLVPIGENIRARDVSVILDARTGTLLVSLRGNQKLLEGTLSGVVSSSGMTWQIEGEGEQRAVSIELEKGAFVDWPSLLIGGPEMVLKRKPSPEETGSAKREEVVQSAKDTRASTSLATEDDEIIELNTRDMRREFDDYDEDGEDDLTAELMDALEQELENEMAANRDDDDDRLSADASMRTGELPLQELLEYYKATALGKTTGSESPEMAAMQVALFYSRGIVVKQDFVEAARWYEMAAEQGSDTAMFHLGLLHQEGLGMPVDVMKAIEWWQKAADLGNANAIYNLGVMYINGHGVPRDPNRAIELFSRAKELDPSLPFPPFGDPSEESRAKEPSRPLTAEEKARQRENAIENLRYMFWTTTALTVAAIGFFGVRYWWKNRL